MNRIKKVFEEKVSNKPSWQKNWKKFLYCQFLCLQQKTDQFGSLISDSRSPSNGRKRSYKIL